MSVDRIPIWDSSTDTNKYVTVADLASGTQDQLSYATTVTLSAGVANTVTHNLATFDVMVQTYDATTYETVFVEVDRTGSNTITVKACTAPPNNISARATHPEIDTGAVPPDIDTHAPP